MKANRVFIDVLRVVADLFHQLTTIQTGWDEREYQHQVNLLPSFRDSQHKAQSAHKVSIPYQFLSVSRTIMLIAS